EVFELIGPQAAEPEPPHLEDIWVRELRATGRSATPAQRRAILAATAAGNGELLFGAPLTAIRSTAYLPPGTGDRSLLTVIVPSRALAFSGAWRDESAQPDIRVKVPLPGVGERVLAVKDHHLLLKAEAEGANLDRQVERLQSLVHAMGGEVALRLGMSRA